VGGGQKATLLDCLEMIAAALWVPARWTRLPAARGDVRETHADIGRAERELGYEPRVDLEEGIKQQVRWALQAGNLWESEEGAASGPSGRRG
jgi:nucleoside-diphosphate-sugar epimerase